MLLKHPTSAWLAWLQLTRAVDLKNKWWPKVEAHLSPEAKRTELEAALHALTDDYAVTYCG